MFSFRRTCFYLASLTLLLSAVPCAGQIAFDTTKLIFHFHGETSTAGAGRRLASLGDVNGDGYDDIAVYAANVMGVYVFFGGNPVDTFPDMILHGNLGASDPIDLDGDGIDDIVTAYYYDWDDGALYFYKGYGDSLGSVPFDSLRPTVDNYLIGGQGSFQGVKTGYVDDDAYGDIVTYKHNTPTGPTLCYYSGCPAIDTSVDWTYKVNNYTHTFSGLGFIDFNGDNQLDIYVGMYADLDTLSYVYIFFGPDFGANPDVIIGHPADIAESAEEFVEELANIGDINGDGWADLGVLFFNIPLIYYCGPGRDTVYDVRLLGTSNVLARAGDINGDGYNDLVMGLCRVLGGAVDVYVGGPKFDSQWDMSIYRSDLPEPFLDMIGRAVSSAGDFNGDGYGDFVFSCDNYTVARPGDVFVVAGGPYIKTGIDDAEEEPLPNQLNLGQNYPNPFNMSTRIEFELVRSETVTLDIYNVLGEKVARLADECRYQSGSHVIEWDGRLSDRSYVSSGVYFYQLVTQSSVGSKKMIVLK